MNFAYTWQNFLLSLCVQKKNEKGIRLQEEESGSKTHPISLTAFVSNGPNGRRKAP